MRLQIVLIALAVVTMTHCRGTIGKIRSLRQANVARFRNERRLEGNEEVEARVDPALAQAESEKAALTNQIAIKEIDIQDLTQSINYLHNSIDDLTDNFLTQVSEISNMINLDT